MRNIYTGAAMTGKKILRNTFGIAALVCAASVPSYCSTAFLQYSGSWGSLGTPNGITTNCSATCTSSNQTLSAFEIPVNQVVIGGTPGDAADVGTWSITGGEETYAKSGSTVTLTITGTIGTCSGCVGTTNLGGVNGALETISYTGLTNGIPYNGALTGTSFDTTGGSLGSFNLTLGAATSVADLSTLLTDLGETGTTSSTISSGSVNASGSGGTGSGNHTFNTSGSLTSEDLTITQTPEPMSFVLLGTGLMAVALIARRRRVSQN